MSEIRDRLQAGRGVAGSTVPLRAFEEFNRCRSAPINGPAREGRIPCGQRRAALTSVIQSGSKTLLKAVSLEKFMVTPMGRLLRWGKPLIS